MDIGVVARTIVDRALDGRLTERLEVRSSFAVPEPGRLVPLGTTTEVVRPETPATPTSAGEANGSALPLAPTTVGTLAMPNGGMQTMVNLGETTRVVHRMLNTMVQNSGSDQTLAHSVDLNLRIGNFAKLMTLVGAQAAASRVATEVTRLGTR